MNEHDEIERAKSLVLETANLMAKYQRDSDRIVANLQQELDKSLSQQRQMMTSMVRDELLVDVADSVRAYLGEMEIAKHQMSDQVREFNLYLNKVTSVNRQMASRSLLIMSVTLATLLIGALALIFFYADIIRRNKLDADMLERINRADMVRCGQELCVKTGKLDANGYRIVLKRP